MNAINTSAAMAALCFATLPALGQPLEGGTFHGVTTLKDGTHAAIVLLPNKAPTRMSHAAAKAWAESVGGQLMTRPVAAQLYANAKDQFERSWYWTAEELQDDTGDEDDASYAWYCHFSYGSQNYDPRSAEGAAVAVRLIQLTA